MVQEFSCQPVTLEVWADSWTSLCGIYGGQCSNGIGFSLSTSHSGDRGSTVVKVLCYNSEGRRFDPSWCQWIFH